MIFKRFIIGILALLTVNCSHVVENNPKSCAIASAHPLATQAGCKILDNGGHAFDAAVAAVFTSMTSEFALTGAFGGGTCLGFKKGEEPFIYDFFVDSPTNLSEKKEFKEISVNFGNTSQEFFIGNGSIAPPGNLKGLVKLHQDYGVLPLEKILKPDINYADKGVLLK